MKKTNVILILFLILILIGLTNCGPGIKGYGVVLWVEKQNGIKTGDIVKVLSESELQDTYIIYKKGIKPEVQIKRWRVEYFDSLKGAEKYLLDYSKYKDMYAYSEKEGVPPIREVPINTSSVKIICKPKSFQPLKIIGKSDEKEKIGEMEDYWYHVLVEYQGIDSFGHYRDLAAKGYCFGYYLNIINTKGDPDQEIANLAKENEKEDILDDILNSIWRPSYFKDMIKSGRIDLDVFHSGIGIFFNPEMNRITITSNEETYFFEYSDIIRIRSNLFSFQGTQVWIEAYSPYRISVTYSTSEKQISEQYIRLNVNIDELVNKEEEIRNSLFNNFYLRGTSLSSSAYGKIILDENKNFVWKGFNKLVPSILPKNSSNRGWIDFPYYFSASLNAEYDGVITFYFAGGDTDKGINFIYKFSEEGVRFLFIKENLIQEREVKRTGINPIVLFFTFSGS